MQLNEISRLAQLDDDAKDVVSKASAKFGIAVFDLAEQISQTINSMSASEVIHASRWYAEANEFAKELANEFNTTTEIVAGIISAVSPRMPWLRNKKVARELLEMNAEFVNLSADDAAKAMGLGLSANVGMAIKIARGANINDTLSGTKRRSFFNNIIAPFGGDSVTVDTWMLMAYCNITGQPKSEGLKFIRANEKTLNGTGAGYILISESVRMVAKEMNLPANQVQAIYWTAVSGSLNGGRSDIS